MYANEFKNAFDSMVSESLHVSIYVVIIILNQLLSVFIIILNQLVSVFIIILNQLLSVFIIIIYYTGMFIYSAIKNRNNYIEFK